MNVHWWLYITPTVISTCMYRQQVLNTIVVYNVCVKQQYIQMGDMLKIITPMFEVVSRFQLNHICQQQINILLVCIDQTTNVRTSASVPGNGNCVKRCH